MFKKLKSITQSLVKNLERKKTGDGLRGVVVTMCRKCYTFYYNNTWHFEAPEFMRKEAEKFHVHFNFTDCPDCIQEEMVGDETVVEYSEPF